ncbi:MAG: chemotaxis-specific protein-glutamate methyltransferase CheB [Parvularculaceae bacterium]
MSAAGGKPIRVLIVEDSSTARRLLEGIINADPRLEVVGSAPSGEKALAMLDSARPEIITMDIRLPGIDGIETTKRIMNRRPTPIIIVASVESREQAKISIEALKAGALSVIEKPRGVASSDFSDLARRLRRQLVLMSDVKLVRHRRPTASFKPPRMTSAPIANSRTSLGAVGIVASTGGPNAFMEILRGLGSDYPAPILGVQHITPSFTEGFASWLGGATRLSVEIAAHGATPMPGRFYLAPGDTHLELVNGRLSLSRGPAVCSQRPSGNVLFRSLASSLGPDCVAVLLTGMGDDGAEGLRAAFDAGAHTIVEDESTAIVYGMPAAAIALGAATEALPLPQIAPRLRELALRGARAAS